MKHIFYLLCWPLSYIFYLRNRKPLRVLAYHKVNDSKHFEQQLGFLKKRFNVISVEALDTAIQHNRELPEYTAVITFDDGDISLKKNAVGLLKKYDLKAMVFVITELINTRKPFWWDHVVHAYGKGNYVQGRQEVDRLKKLPNKDRVIRLEEIRNEKPFEQEQLTLEALHHFEKGGLAVGNHTHTHPMLDRSTDVEIENEFRHTKQFFDSSGLKGHRYFAYPNGNADDRTEAKLKEAGVGMAFLFDHRLNDTINPLRISRLKVNDYLTLPEFYAKVSGFHSFLMNLRRTE